MNAYDLPVMLPVSEEIETINTVCIPYYQAGISQGITVGSLVTMIIYFIQQQFNQELVYQILLRCLI